MPGDPFAIARHFAKEMRAPGNHVLANQVLDTGHNTRICQDVVNPSMAEMRRGDRVAVAPCGKRPGQQFIKVRTDAGYLVLIEDANAGQVTVAIKSCNLLRGQSCGTLGGGRMKPQIAVKLAQLFAAWDELGCSQRFHSSDSVSLGSTYQVRTEVYCRARTVLQVQHEARGRVIQKRARIGNGYAP
jgi:hypothetical protein